jgi:hypothetical protein
VTEPTSDAAEGAADPRPDASPDTRERPAPALAAVVRLWLEPTVRAVPVYVVVDGELVMRLVDRPVGAVLTELRAELTPSGEAGGSGRGGGTVLAIDVLDATEAVYGTVLEWCAMLGLKPRSDRRLCRSCRTSLHDCRHEIEPDTEFYRIGPRGMTCCSHHDHPAAVDPIADGMRRLPVHGALKPAARDQLARILDRQRVHAERVLAGDSARYVSGTRCPRPQCKVERVREDDGTIHGPLRIDRERSESPDGRPGPILGTRCTACTTWWPYAEMGEDGSLQEALEADREGRDADRAAVAARRAARQAEEAQRAAAYGRTDGSARRLGLPVPCRVCGLPALGGDLCADHPGVTAGGGLHVRV